MDTDNRIRAVLVTVSDLHINSTVALSVPSINLDDGGTYHASRTQRWLNDCWLDLWGRLDRDYPADKWQRKLIFNGDMGELDTKRRSIQLVSINKDTIKQLVLDTIEPAVNWANSVYVIRGTAAHEGKSAWFEETIAKDISNVIRFSNKGAASFWHLQGTVDGTGVPIDVSHHANMGRIPWTRKNSCNALAAKTLWQFVVERGIQPPKLLIRSHNHVCEDSELKGVHVWYTPAWTTLTEYGYRGGFENELAQVGAVVAECEAGQEKSYKIIYEPKGERRVWQLKI